MRSACRLIIRLSLPLLALHPLRLSQHSNNRRSHQESHFHLTNSHSDYRISRTYFRHSVLDWKCSVRCPISHSAGVPANPGTVHISLSGIPCWCFNMACYCCGYLGGWFARLGFSAGPYLFGRLSLACTGIASSMRCWGYGLGRNSRSTDSKESYITFNLCVRQVNFAKTAGTLLRLCLFTWALNPG